LTAVGSVAAVYSYLPQSTTCLKWQMQQTMTVANFLFMV